MIRASKLFSRIAAKSLFKISVIGGHPSSLTLIETPPPVVLQYTKYISLQSYAFSIDPCAWLDHLTSIKGIHCEGSGPHPYWDKLEHLLYQKPIKPIHLSIRLNVITPDLPGFDHFDRCMESLSTTLESISIDMEGCDSSSEKALQTIKTRLMRLTSIRFHHIGPDCSKLAFAPKGWACKDGLRSLYLSNCSLVFRFLSKFIAYAVSLQSLFVEDCSACDASEGVAFLEIPGSHALKRVEIPQYCGKGINQASIALMQSTTSRTAKITWIIV